MRSQIMRQLEWKGSDNMSITRDISNAIATANVAKRSQPSGLTNMGVAVGKLRDLSWRCKFREGGTSWSS